MTLRSVLCVFLVCGPFIASCVTVNVDDDSNELAKPDAPSGLIAEGEESLVLLNWQPVTAADSYVLLRSGSSGGPYTAIFSSPTTFYADKGVTNGTPYYYVVQAVNDAGTGQYSAEVSATPKAVTEPTAPSSCTNTQGGCFGQTTRSGEHCLYNGASSVEVALTVYDYQTDQPKGAVAVKVVDNTSGLATGICSITDSFGQAIIKVPKNTLVGFSIVKEGAPATYTFNKTYAAIQTLEALYSMSNVTFQLLHGLLGVTPAPGAGLIMGVVHNQYGNATTDITPMHVYVDGSEAFYFANDGLPADLSTQTALNPDNALFVGLNVAAGSTAVTMTYNGNATTTSGGNVMVFPNSAVLVELGTNLSK